MTLLQSGARATLAIALTVMMASCTSAPAPSAPPEQTATTEPANTAPLACGGLVSADAATAALTGADGVAPEVVEAVQPSHALEYALLKGAGGLSCSWRAGAGQLLIGAEEGDWAYLSIEVLPDAAEDWVPPYLGDVPSTEHRMVGEIEATSSVGEGGWRISAPVGSA